MVDAGNADSRSLLDRASRARQSGDHPQARLLLGQLLASQPEYAPAWNLLGVVELEIGDAEGAKGKFRRVTELDPGSAVVWLNLARAERATGDRSAETASLDAALERDPYLLPALLEKGEALRALGREIEALQLYRQVLNGIEADARFPEPISRALATARAFLGQNADRQAAQFETELAKIAGQFPDSDLSRAAVFAAQRAGTRKVFVPGPTDGFFPFLPAFEYFDRSLFPWFAELEAQTSDIRGELLSIWAQDDTNFRPYVAFAPGSPVAQWHELNHSPRWSAWFLIENGVPNQENRARCPITAAVIDRLPLLDVPGKGPTVMFSVLAPHTRIPPHSGSTNTRTTVHLPLVVPPGNGFRVGGETREWKEGEAWAFDDTIEHEAWNDSDQPRAILILDSWNPLLTEPEKALVRAIG